MATLKELAEYTGFSSTTISRILNNDPTMAASEETRKKVIEAAGALNYTTSRSKKGGGKTALRIALAEMLSPAEQLEDPYYLYLRRFVEHACMEQKIELLSLLYQEETGYSLLTPSALDGIIAIGIFTRRQVEMLHRLSGNVVFLDSAPDERRSDAVVINYRLGVYQALEVLMERGHTRIGFIGPAEKLDDWKQPAPERRHVLFTRFMTEHGLFSPDLLVDVPMNTRLTTDALTAYLKKNTDLPTAFLTANEENAIGAMRALQRAGLRVPEDVSIVSFNDTPLSEMVDPPLTSISTRMQEMSALAVQMVCERSGKREGARTYPVKVIVPPTLVLRDTVAAPRK